MKKEIIIGLMFIFALSFISANPPMPCAFFGNVTHLNQTFPNGHFITAKINDVVSGECEIIDEKYGYGKNTCIILSYKNNLNIKFYIGDKEIGEGLFEDKEVVGIDFEVDFIPETSGNFSNGICEPELGECSFNILDCDSSITDACKGNGICDSVIGETCSTCPEDCGNCPSSSSSSSGGSSSSSSGGGGGGSSSSSGGSSTPNTSSNHVNLNFETEEEELESNEEIKEQKELGAGITGGVIGFVKSGKGIGLIFAFIIIVLGIGVVTIKKKKSKSSKENIE